MSQPSPRRLPRPPHNPGLQALVEAKREACRPPVPENIRRGFRGWHERGYLPHRDEPGLTQFVTFRLADCFPTELRGEWEILRAIEDDRDRALELEAYLDRGRSECLLRRTEAARVVESALLFFHGQRYELRAWVVMPNHVHVLFTVWQIPMSQIVGAWKRFTAHEINKALGRRGSVWAEDYWDTYMRDDSQTVRTMHYIETNPVKAFLVREPSLWLVSSARHRGEFGHLRL